MLFKEDVHLFERSKIMGEYISIGLGAQQNKTIPKLRGCGGGSAESIQRKWTALHASAIRRPAIFR
jgi:hypothetical protein